MFTFAILALQTISIKSYLACVETNITAENKILIV